MSSPAKSSPGLRGRALVSLLVTWSFVALFVSGLVLFVQPHGSYAYRHGWTLLGLGKDAWDDLHAVSGLLFLVSGVWHLTYNWAILCRHLRSLASAAVRPSWELLLATAIVLLLLLGAALRLPPVSYVSDLSEAAKRAWVKPGEYAPTPGAGGRLGRGRGLGR